MAEPAINHMQEFEEQPVSYEDEISKKADVIDFERYKEKKAQENYIKLFKELNSYADGYLEQPFSEDNFKEIYKGREKIRERLNKQEGYQKEIMNQGILQYAKKHYSSLKKKLGLKGLAGVLSQIKIKKTGNKDYDRILESLEFPKRIYEEEDKEEKRGYLEELSKRYLSDYDKKIFDFIKEIRGEHFYQLLEQACFSREKKIITNYIEGRDPKISRDEIKNFFYKLSDENKKNPKFLEKLVSIFYFQIAKKELENRGRKKNSHLVDILGLENSPFN
jgi:hypothetical protein